MFTPQATEDGSFTFFSETFQEHFHSHAGAKLEAEGKFILPCRLAERSPHTDHLYLLDICYGLGYNSAAALEKIWQINPDCQITLIALENDLTVPQGSAAQGLLDPWSDSVRKPLQLLAETGTFVGDRLKAQLIIGDARQTIQQVYQQKFLADAIFLDPFSPPKCPQLWTVEFLEIVSQCLAKNGYLATYSCAAAVRSALQLAGLFVGSTDSIGRRSPGTLARYQYTDLQPLSPEEIEHLQTRAAIPYRDPNLENTIAHILQTRFNEQLNSPLETTSQWKKRWSKPTNNTFFP